MMNGKIRIMDKLQALKYDKHIKKMHFMVSMAFGNPEISNHMKNGGLALWQKI